MIAPERFWQRLEPAGSFPVDGPFDDFVPAVLPGGRQLLLPIRTLPGDGTRGVAGLICNQASFEVLDALADALTALVAPLEPTLIVGVPTLGLPLAEAVARRLGHQRTLALSTSRKFWYRDDWSELLSSITTPERQKRLYVDPRLVPLFEGQRVVVIDDVVSSGQSVIATLSLLAKIGVVPAAVAVAMEQGQRWRGALAAADPSWPALVRGVFASPLLRRDGELWRIA